MRRFVYISALVFLYLVLTAKSCDDRHDNDDAGGRSAQEATIDSLRSLFESDIVTPEQLRVYEASARMKLGDLDDYLAIVHDTAAGKVFRDKAQAMILQLLVPGTGPPEIPGRIIPGSVWIVKPLQRTAGSVYSGALGYSLSPAIIGPADPTTPDAKTGTIGFRVAKHRKAFGTDTLMVWEVFLGN